MLSDQRERTGAVLSLRYHGYLAASGQRPHHTLAKKRVVIADNHPHKFAAHLHKRKLGTPNPRVSPNWGTSRSSGVSAGRPTYIPASAPHR
ncbi:hypothetical protein NJBCHELONAE_00210 [Mycobacteroides chelonae]|nr:hypothetical protein NJBCHELONAE_00210 [Mycobacteroides chelonae]